MACPSDGSGPAQGWTVLATTKGVNSSDADQLTAWFHMPAGWAPPTVPAAPHMAGPNSGPAKLAEAVSGGDVQDAAEPDHAPVHGLQQALYALPWP